MLHSIQLVSVGLLLIILFALQVLIIYDVVCDVLRFFGFTRRRGPISEFWDWSLFKLFHHARKDDFGIGRFWR